MAYSIEQLRGAFAAGRKAAEAPKEKKNDVAKVAVDKAVRTFTEMIDQYGRTAFSLQGPAPDYIEAVARELFRHAGDEGMDEAFDRVEDYALGKLGGFGAAVVGSCLDHRFNGIGGWLC